MFPSESSAIIDMVSWLFRLTLLSIVEAVPAQLVRMRSKLMQLCFLACQALLCRLKALFSPLFLTDNCWLRCIPALKTSVSSLASPDTFVSNLSRILLASSEAEAALHTSCVMGL